MPWVVTARYATEGEFGGAAHVTRLKTQDYSLTTLGVAISVLDRFKASLVRQQLDAGSVIPSTTLTLDLLGVSRVSPAMRAGGLQLYPQLTLGAEWKHLNPGSSVVPIVAGVISKTSGVDLYVSTTKLFLGPGVLVNATLRATRANQNGWLLSVPYAITS